MTLTDQDQRLAAAYQKMSCEGRDTLDRLVGQLAEVHRDAAQISPAPGDWDPRQGHDRTVSSGRLGQP